MRVLIADDHELVRDAVSSLLQLEGVVCETANDIDSCVSRLGSSDPFDVVLLDFSMPGMEGLKGVGSIIGDAKPSAVALFSGLASMDVVQRCLQLGAKGFIPKTLPADELMGALRTLASGNVYLPADHLRSSGYDQDSAQQFAKLSARQRDVLRCLCRGLANKEIARELELQEATVKMYIKALFLKIGARNRAHAVAKAREANFT